MTVIPSSMTTSEIPVHPAKAPSPTPISAVIVSTPPSGTLPEGYATISLSALYNTPLTDLYSELPARTAISSTFAQPANTPAPTCVRPEDSVTEPIDVPASEKSLNCTTLPRLMSVRLSHP